MNRFRRSVNAAVNPVSTAATRWWCHSALRHMLTGHGPTARQRRLIARQRPLIRHGPLGVRLGPRGVRLSAVPPSAEQLEARRRAIDKLLTRDGREPA